MWIPDQDNYMSLFHVSSLCRGVATGSPVVLAVLWKSIWALAEFHTYSHRSP